MLQAVENGSTVSSGSFIHLVTLINWQALSVKVFLVFTTTDRLCDVMREVACQRAERGLLGYQYFKAEPINNPLPF